MYKLIGSPQSRAMRVMWLLEELGETYEQIPAAPRSEEARAYNPTGKIPALVVGDVVLTDSIAICTYLADKYGKCTFPAGTIERAKQDSFTQFAVDELDGVLWTAAKNSFVHAAEIRVPAIKDVCRIEFATALKTLQDRLGDGPYVMGETFTIADLLIGHCATWARAAKFDLPEDGPLYDYFKRLRDRPAHRAAVAKAKEFA